LIGALTGNAMGARLQYMSKDEITEEKVQEAMRVSKNK